MKNLHRQKVALATTEMAREDDEPPSMSPAPAEPGEVEELPSPPFLGSQPGARPFPSRSAARSAFPQAKSVIDFHRCSFRKRFFPEASAADWNDWQWQMQNSIRDARLLARMIRLSEAEQEALAVSHGGMPMAVTPYYASLIDPVDPAQPLRRTMIPVVDECFRSLGEDPDPLGEDHQSPVPGLVHRYPDRVLFLATNCCAAYCRYCTRSRIMDETRSSPPGLPHWERAIEYIEATPAVRDVLISGGDPLTLGDERLEWLLQRLHRIPHLEIIRIGTKVPVVLPMRVTPRLVRILRRFHPLWMSIHFTHPDELTPQVAQACARLADAGIPLGSQTVLLAGVNDDLETMRRLMHGLLRLRVRPYYLYQCDPIVGTSHFRTSVEKGLEIIRGLRGHTSGYAVPTYVIDAPEGGGKIPLLPDYREGREGNDILLRNYEGGLFRYPDCVRDGAS